MDKLFDAGEMPSHWVSGAPRRWRFALGLILVGIALLSLLAWLEARWLKAQPWSTAVWTHDYQIDAHDAEVCSRELPIEQSLGTSPIVRMIQEDLIRESKAQAKRAPVEKDESINPLDTKGLLNLDFVPRASLVMLDISVVNLEPVLASGRLPVPGAREVLAGFLLSDRALEIDGEVFTVTGRILPQASGFSKVFLLPSDPTMTKFFDPDNGARHGSFVANTRGRLEMLVPELFDPALAELPAVHGGPVQTLTYIAWGIWLSLLLVAAGASVALIEVYRHLSRIPLPIVADAMRETVLRPRLLWGLHLFFFGGFFGAMALGLLDPELNYFFTQYASHEFSEGGLKYVGDAYASGNFAQAAHATYHNNFIVQTLQLTAAISLIPPFVFGLFKILLSFVVVGFAMAPLWTETASGMTYHAITLGLELPPYVLVGFGAFVWAECIWGLIWSPLRMWYLVNKANESMIQDAARQVPRGLMVLAGCTIVSAVFLYIAAWYEAVTLISFR